MIKHFEDLEVYRLSYDFAMDLFKLTRNFPKEELYSLTSQMVRSSRSIPGNISEGWSKRRHENIFKRHLLDAIGSMGETKTWLDFAKDCSYLEEKSHKNLIVKLEKIGAKLFNLHESWKTF
jgi:four helix bundle protein